MIRAAAKNHAHVSVCVDAADYDDLLSSLGSTQEAPDAVNHRKRLAWKAFQHCASYDTTVADWLWQQMGDQSAVYIISHPQNCSKHYELADVKKKKFLKKQKTKKKKRRKKICNM
jgi:AICAR transformylase/IMP cyclohydrolase PurH